MAIWPIFRHFRWLHPDTEVTKSWHFQFQGDSWGVFWINSAILWLISAFSPSLAINCQKKAQLLSYLRRRESAGRRKVYRIWSPADGFWTELYLHMYRLSIYQGINFCPDHPRVIRTCDWLKISCEIIHGYMDHYMTSVLSLYLNLNNPLGGHLE